MLPLDDPRWKEYQGGYRVPYDASVPLRRLLTGGTTPDLWKELWKELWDELHHQGDVGSASYAAVPYLVEMVRRSESLDWNAPALIAVIELQRPRNPSVQPELAQAYFQALAELPQLLVAHPQREWSEPLTGAAAACVALARGQRVLARAYLELNVDAARQWLIAESGYHLSDLL